MRLKRMVSAFASLGLLCASFAHAATDSNIKSAAESKEWRRLMHYATSFWGGTESRVDGPAYFFSPSGKNDPEAELRASLQAFDASRPESQNLKIGKLKLAPQCALPHRYRWLKRRFGLNYKDVPCPELNDYLDKFKAKTLSVVFSSAYPNNPGSMFGHTFFKFTSGVRSELLDQSVSYAANIGQDGGIIYMARGIFGGYLGAFSLTPYYVKVNEYNHSESRDLWEYELALTEDEVQSVILHLWDIEANSWFDYYFFDENCALILMTAIEVVKPEWTLSDFNLYTIPGETTKRLARYPEAIRSVRFRPSMRKSFLQAQAVLNPLDREQLTNIRVGKFPDQAPLPASPLGLETAPNAPALNARVLDTAALYFQYVKQRDGKSVSPDAVAWHRETLQRRSRLKNAVGLDPSTLPEHDRSNRPDLGHHPKRLILGGGWSKSENQQPAQPVYDLGFRFAYRDLLNFDDGYERFSHFEFPGGVLRYYGRDRSLTVENITPVAITSLFPWSDLERRISWKFLLDYRSLKDIGCPTCHAVRMDVGAGVTATLIADRWLFSVLGGVQPEAGSSLRGTFRWGPKVEFSTIGTLTRRLKARWATSVIADVLQPYRSIITYEHRTALAWSIAQNTELRGEALWIPPTRSMGAGHSESRLAFHLFF